MKATSTFNLIVFAALTATLGFELVRLADSSRPELFQLESALAELRFRRNMATSSAVQQAVTQAGHDESLNLAYDDFVTSTGRVDQLLASITTDVGGCRPAAAVAVRSAKETIGRLDRIRSISAVLRNTSANVPKLLRTLQELAGDNSALRDSFNRFEAEFLRLGVVGRTHDVRSLHKTFEEARIEAGWVGGDVARLGSLVIAQAKTTAAYSEFLQEEFDGLRPGNSGDPLDRAHREATAATGRAQAGAIANLHNLTAASFGLIAFVAAVSFRLQAQSRLLSRINAELEQQSQDERTRHAAEVAAMEQVQGRVVLSTTGEILKANRVFALALGYEGDELTGKNHCDCAASTTADSPEYRRFWEQLREGSFQHGQRECVAKDGSPRWFQANYTPIKDKNGRVSHIVKYATDVTAQVLSERRAAAATEELAELARVIRNAPHELYIFDAETLRFVEVNQGSVDSIGYSRQELFQLTPYDIKPKFDESSFRQAIEPLASGKIDVLTLQTLHQRRDGTKYPTQIAVHRALFNGSHVYVAFVTDTSDLQRLEKQLAQAQKLESLGSLAAGIAHEINTPLQCIGASVDFLNNCVEAIIDVAKAYGSLLETSEHWDWSARVASMRRLLEERRFDFVCQQLPGAIHDCRDAVQRVVAIIRAMRTFSHPGSDQSSLANLNELVHSTVAITRNRWKESAELRCDLDPNLPDAFVNASAINQVLLNLIVNASDAVAEKNHSNGRFGEILIRTTSDDANLRVEVTDNGCGMPDHVKERAFDPFFTTKEVGKGTGQGLSIVYNIIVQQHGGSICVNSVEGEGTSFTVTLPRSAPAASVHTEIPEKSVFSPAEVS